MRNSEDNMKKCSCKDSYSSDYKVAIVIPTFGKRAAIINKLKLIDKILEYRELNKYIQKIYIVFSEPDDHILKKVYHVKDTMKNYKKIEIITERKRRGKAAAINLALRRITKDLGNRTIVIVNDDDAFFDAKTLQNIILTMIRDEQVAVASVFPKYQSKFLNILYGYKRLIHKLESMLCNPATIAGEMLAFKLDIIGSFYEETLSEDFQLGMICSSKNKRIALLEGNVVEPYPSTFHGLVSRTERTVLGTIMEVKRLLKKIENVKCKFIYVSYLYSLLSLPISTISLILLIFISTYILLSQAASHIMFLSSLMLIVVLVIAIVKRIRNFVYRFLLFILSINYGILKALIRVLMSNKMEVVAIWKETKV